MADFKVTSFFTFPGRVDASAAGWSETWYLQATDLAQAQAGMQLFYQARRGLLADPCVYAANRVSQIGANRISQLFPMQGGSNFPGTTGQSDNAWQCALISCRTGLGFHRSWYLRGVPDGLFDIADPSNPAYIAWLGRWNTFRAAIAALTFPVCMRLLDRISNPLKLINAFNYAEATNTLSIDFDVDPGWIIGNYVRFYGMTGWYPALGVRQISSKTIIGGTTTFYFDYEGSEGDPLTPKSKAMRAVWGIFQIEAMNWLRTGHRDTGRPFNLQRGRAPRRA